MLSSVVSVFTVHQHESVRGKHMSPPSCTSVLPPSTSHPCRFHEHKAELPALCNNFPLAIYFTHGNVCISILLSQFILTSPSPTVSISLLCMSRSLFLHSIWVHQYHFSRFHINALMHNICFCLSDLLHSI